MGKGVSLNTKDFVTGGLLDDVDVTFVNPHFEMFDYGGGQTAPGLLATLVTGAEGDDDPAKQFWSAGSAESWAPAEDGMSLVPIGKDSALRKSTNLFMLLKSLEEQKFPMERLNDGDISILEGMQCHIIRKAAPKREGLSGSSRRGQDGKEYEQKVCIVERIIKLPWENDGAKEEAKPKGGGKGKGKAAKEAAPETAEESSGGDGSFDEKAKAAITKMLADNGGSVATKEAPSKLMPVLGNDKDKNKILALLFKPAEIKKLGFAVADDGTISFG